MRRPVALALVAMAVITLVPALARADDARADATSNIKRLASFGFEGADGIFNGASDLAFSGRYAYVGHMGPKGGVHIFDIKGRPREVGFLPCTGGQNDVAVVRPGLLAVGYQTSGPDGCGATQGGVTFVDVSDPSAPRKLGMIGTPPYGAHTLTALPGTSLVYASPGGWDQEAGGENGALESIIDASDPLRPRIVGSVDLIGAGCHDLTFRKVGDRVLGFCAGDTSTHIWDMTDPLAPTNVSTIVNPLITFHHSAVASPDGEVLVISDETYASDCVGATTGSMWLYDISDPSSPILAGNYDIPRGPLTQPLDYTCTAHNFEFIPRTRTLVAAWYRAGMDVIDLSDPTSPKEVAHYMPDDGSYWSAYPFRNRIYASGLPGLDVFEVDL